MSKKIFCLIILAAFLTPAGAVFAHDGKPHDYADLWRAWSFDPLSVASLAVSAAVYISGLRNLWRASGTGSAISRREAAAFAGGWIFLFVALVSPLHPWGEVLFSAHMTQHEILMLVAAPLFVLSRPFVAALWALPRAARKSVNGVVKTRAVTKTWRLLTNPFVAWLVHAVALWTWHIPFLFQATLKSDLVHTLQHASFFLSALVFWYAIMAAPRGVANYGAGVLYLFTTSVHSGLLGVFLTLTGKVWYPAYEKSTAAWGLTPLEDQQIGGLIMWIPAGLVYIFAGLLMFAGWLRESEKRVVRREGKMLPVEPTL
ncbi:MAG TPA: cytochrome c oxidase assembly protein [Pyrinomonadaceae bacterium]|jgi:putative membrane protein